MDIILTDLFMQRKYVAISSTMKGGCYTFLLLMGFLCPAFVALSEEVMSCPAAARSGKTADKMDEYFPTSLATASVCNFCWRKNKDKQQLTLKLDKACQVK